MALVDDLPLPSSPESEKVFLQLLIRELAFQASQLLRGLDAKQKLEEGYAGIVVNTLREMSGFAGRAQQLRLQEAVDLADAYLTRGRG